MTVQLDGWIRKVDYSMKIYKLSMPLYVKIGGRSSKKYHINMNQFMGWHFNTKNSVKVTYMDIACKLLKGIKMTTPIKLTFVMFTPDLRRRDRANICSMHEKFFCDALQLAACIPDDNDKYILETRYITGGLDRSNPRMEIIVEEV